MPWVQFDEITTPISVLLYSYVMGFFVMLSIFELVIFPGAIFSLRFNMLCAIYSFLIIGVLIISIIYIKKKTIIDKIEKIKKRDWTKMGYLYMSVFFCFLLFQLLYAVFFSRTTMADDGYSAFSSMAIADNYVNLTGVYNGIYIIRDATWFNRVVQTVNYFPAYLSFISSIKPIIIDHTIMYVLVLILAYAAYSVLAGQMFENRENRLLFLILVEALYIWGFHSHYSITFRLLGPNSEGKAILATVLAPFMLSIMYRVIIEGYRNRIGLQVFILSIAACGLSLGGVYTVASILIAMTFISAIKNKSFRVILYLLWGGIFPTILSVAYLYLRFRWG